MHWLTKLAANIYRPKTFKKSEAPNKHQLVKFLTYGTLFIITWGLFVWLLSKEVLRWNDISPNVAIEPASWRLLSSPLTPSCSNNIINKTDCPANPANPELWNSPLRRANPRTARRSSTPLKEFWIGSTIPVEALKEAQKVGANHLILGLIRGEFRVWVNGEMLATAPRGDQSPIILSLPMSWLEKSDPLRIAIWVKPLASVSTPDVLARPLQEGFVTKSKAGVYASFMDFWRKSKPLSFFLLNVLFSSIFYFLWRADREKQEYFYLAVYALICGMFQIRRMDMFQMVFSADLSNSFDLVLRISEGTFGMFLGFSFARSRKEFFKWGIPLSIIAPPLIVFSIPWERSQSLVNLFVDGYIVPAFYFAGALPCFLQAFYLRTEKKRGSSLPGRRRQLLFFGAGLIAIGLVFLFQNEMFSFTQRALVSRLFHFVLIFFLGAVAIVEYRERRNLIEKTPISPYHRRAVLPEMLTGAILVADLKNSERLLQNARVKDQPSRIVYSCLSHMWSGVIAYKGTLLQTEGDQLIAFFDQERCASPVLNALEATNEMAKKLRLLKEQFANRDLLPDNIPDLYFRAGVAYGHIKPIWHEVEGTRLPSWVDTDDTQPFVESARMMELERIIPGSSTRSLVLLQENLVKSALPDGTTFNSSWLFRSHVLEGKHGKLYLVAAYMPQTEE